MTFLHALSMTTTRTRWALTVAAFALVLTGCGSTPRDATADWTAEKLYSEAKEEASAGNYERAVKLYERLEGRASGSSLSQQAQLERAYLLYKTNEKAQALTVLERFVKFNPSSPALDYAYYLQGLLNFNDNFGFLGSFAGQDLSERDQQASRDAFQSFKQVVDQFPNSRYAPDSRARMNFILNSLANYEVHVARYYYRRGAYVAALNRAQQAVQDYQQAPSSEEALGIMGHAYGKLGMADLRDDTFRVLKANYPQSRFLDNDAFEIRERRWWQFW